MSRLTKIRRRQHPWWHACAALAMGVMQTALATTAAVTTTVLPDEQASVKAPTAQGAATIDLLEQAERMAKAGAANGHSPSTQPASASPHMLPPPSARLYVFVSFSMPPASLRLLVTQAAAVGVPLVLRGMTDESLSATARRTAELIRMAPGSSVEIDPAPFRRFGITRVPAYLIATPAPACQNACTPENAGDIIVGDVALDYALERLVRGASAPLAQRYLDILRKRP